MEKLRCKYCENTCVKNGTLQTFWRTSSDNKLRGYFYEYDQLNRLQKAHYAKVGMGVSFFPGAYDEQLTYDRNGNILSLLRHTGDANENQIGMDNLAYTYQNGNQNSNRLMKVTDAVSGSSAGGFSNGSSGTNNDYTYDENGNMISDLNKGITEILYNHLNLPTSITFANGSGIEYFYNAAGEKLRKTVNDTQNNTIKVVEYLDGFQYAGGVLQFFPHAEGYVAATQGTKTDSNGNFVYIFNYVNNYTDHLGNIRVSYTKDPVSGELEIMEETEARGSRTPNKRRSHKTNDSEQNHYYPFGLKHDVYAPPQQKYELDEEDENLARPAYVYETEYQYKYNGKEWQDELGLGWYDYQWRNYDPAIGRWHVIDPLAEMSRKTSPYAYALNNPVFFIDPDGMFAEGFNTDELGSMGDIGFAGCADCGPNGEGLAPTDSSWAKGNGDPPNGDPNFPSPGKEGSPENPVQLDGVVLILKKDTSLMANALRAYKNSYDPRFSPPNFDGFSVTGNLHFNALLGHGGGSLSFVMGPGQFGFVWDGYGGWGPSTVLGVSGGVDMGFLDLYGGARDLEQALKGPSTSWGGQVGPLGANYSTTVEPDGTVAPQGVRQYNVNVFGWGLKGGKLGNTSVSGSKGFHRSDAKFFKF